MKNNRSLILKYWLISLVLVGFSACANDAEHEVPVVSAEKSRSTITIERTIELEVAGTLQSQIEAAMEGEDVSTLQKLTLSGPFTGVDVEYWKTALSNLIEMDLTNAIPTYVEGQNTYKDPDGNDQWLNTNQVASHMFSKMTKLEKIVFPSCVDYIGYRACWDCTSLMEVILPDNISNMSSYIFADCESLKIINIPAKLTSIPGSFLSNCKSLEKVEIPDGIQRIEWSAFFGCESLTEIVLPNSIEHIGSSSFRNCNLSSIIIPASVTSIEDWAFAENLNLESVNILANITEIPSYTFYRCSTLSEVNLPSSVIKLNHAVFENCTSLKDFSAFNNVKEIYSNAFRNTGFESVDLSNVAILEGCFEESKQLKKVVLPDTISCIKSYMFNYCEMLEEVNLPSSLITIEDGAFRRTALKSVELPISVKSVGYEAFWDIQTLEKVTLNEGLETIGERAFGANLVTEFTIPSTVTNIGNEAFRGTKVKVLTVPATVTEVGGSLINDCRELVALVWNTTAELKDSWGVSSNCYLYLADGNTPCGPNWQNIIIDGVAESVKLAEGGGRTDSNRTYFVPIPFKAKKITFERHFEDWQSRTYFEKASGWQTIVLPFTPTKIEHETKGVIAPFNSGIDGAKPFWLRSLTSDGFIDVTTFTPNVPYIIAMPNNDEYLEEYRLYGKIIFSAENVELEVTPDVLPVSEGPTYSLQPTYNYVQAAPMVYALNVSYHINDYHYGSIFARSSSDVYCFEAYVVPNARSARSVFEINTSSSATRTTGVNKTGIPQIGDM